MSTNLPTHQAAGSVALPGQWENKMAQYAHEGLSNERAPGQLFSTKGGILTFGGIPVPNNRMQVCVLAAMFENVYYPRPYDPNNPESPECYAFSLDGRGMAPHADAEHKQNPTCDGCRWIQWDTGPGGRGKACKEQRRLALLPAAALSDPKAVEDATVGYLRLPVTSTKAFSEHVKHVGMKGLPVFAVVTDVVLAPDPKTMWKFSFGFVSQITHPEVLAAVEKRHLGERQAMAFPYPKNAQPVQVPAPPHAGGVPQQHFNAGQPVPQAAPTKF